MSSLESKPIVVVGAGLAGLAAAWKLRQAGLPVVVLEKEDRAGGQCCGERVQGFDAERGLPLVMSGDTAILDWVREVGLADTHLPLRSVAVAHLRRGRPVPVKTDSLRGLSSIPGLGGFDALHLARLSRLMRRYAPLLDPGAPERAADLDYRSVGDFTKLYFGRRILENWIEPMLASASGGGVDSASRVASLIQWLEEDRSRWGLPRAGLEMLARSVSERLSMRYGFEVKGIQALSSGGYRVATSQASGSGETFEAQAVVFAVSAVAVRQLAQPCLILAEQDALGPIRYAPGATLAIAAPRPGAAVPEFGRVPRSEGLPIASYLVEPGQPGGRVPQGSGLVTLVAREDFAREHVAAGDDVVTKALKSAFDRIDSPGREDIRFMRLYRTSTFLPCQDVGFFRQLANFQKVQPWLRSQGRRLYFAGDYLCGVRANGRVRSGSRAAQALLEDLGHST